MAFVPWFTINPTTVLSLYGYFKKPEVGEVDLAEFRSATVDAVIPTYNEEKNILLCLESLANQTLKPQRIVLIDDNSTDRTVELAKSYAGDRGIDLTVIVHGKNSGKTASLKHEARHCDADVEFVLDGDTVLDSPNYLERLVEELYKADGAASACGLILPETFSDRSKMLELGPMKSFIEKQHPDFSVSPGRFHYSMRNLTIYYRKVLYSFLQRFIYRAEMNYCGTIINPIGCAVAYRREYLKNLFDDYEPVLGDNLTDSEDIFIGFSLIDRGYRNIHVDDVTAKTLEPEAQNLPKQVVLWSSAFLQSCYCFDSLLYSPFKTVKRHERMEEQEVKDEWEGHEQEPYEQPLGENFTDKYGREIGIMIFTGALEKILFPIIILAMITFSLWEPLVLTLIGEALISSTIVGLTAPKSKFLLFIQSILVTPIRYVMMFVDLWVVVKFGYELWFCKDPKWRK